MASRPMPIRAPIALASGSRSGSGATSVELKRHGGGETPRKQTPATDYVIQASPEGQEERDEDNPVIIAEAESPLHEMAVSDAVMQMDLSDRPFVVFRNASHGEINVVYRRDDGNIGWIDPATKKARKRR